MTKTYEYAINTFRNRLAEEVELGLYKHIQTIFTILYCEYEELYKYINDKDITYSNEDELNYLKVRYLIEKYTHYYRKGFLYSYVNKLRLLFTHAQLLTLIVIQHKRQNKRKNKG